MPLYMDIHRKVDGLTADAVTHAHDRRCAIGHEILFLQRWDAAAHQLEQLLFFSLLRPIRHDHDYAAHKIDIGLLRRRD